MAHITVPLQHLAYTGAPQELATAGFLANVQRISRVNDGGVGFVSFRPGDAFNAFTHLEDGGIYIFYSSTVPYEVPTTDTRPVEQGSFVYADAARFQI